MEFNLDRDLVFFDLEATGLNVIRDRIVQIAMVKYKKNGSDPEELSMLINPGVPISAEAMSVHGITPQDVANKPTFVQVAEQIHDFIEQADLAGYNSNRFDVPLLMEEFARAGIDFAIDNRRLLDMQRIFYKMEPRTLKAALRFYCNEEMENAHDALADVRATVDVFRGQLIRYADVDHEDGDGKVTPTPVRNDMEAIHRFTNDNDFLDATQRIKYNREGVPVFNFGKHKGESVAQVLAKDKQYYNWILNKDFSTQVKNIVKRLVREYEQNNP